MKLWTIVDSGNKLFLQFIFIPLKIYGFWNL